MRPLFSLLLLFAAVAGGYLWSHKAPTPRTLSGIDPERTIPVTEFRTFAFIVYAHNHAPWCDRLLRSLYAQHYDHYRVLLIDDASDDTTFEIAQQTIVACGQDNRTLLIQNDEPLGFTASLYRAMDSLLDREIAIPMIALDWVADSNLLNSLNHKFQNPDVWIAEGAVLRYPSYILHYETPFLAFYAGLYKQLSLSTLLETSYHQPLIHLAGGRVATLVEPCLFWNETLGIRVADIHPLKRNLDPLIAFPEPVSPRTGTDVVLLSERSPLRLQTTIEMILNQCSGIHSLTVLYRAPDPQLRAAYEALATSYPAVRFAPFEEGRALGRQLAEIARTTPGETILIGNEQIPWEEGIDLAECSEQLQRARLTAFALHRGARSTRNLGNGVRVLAAEPPVAWTVLRKEQAEAILRGVRQLADLEKPCQTGEIALGLDI